MRIIRGAESADPTSGGARQALSSRPPAQIGAGKWAAEPMRGGQPGRHDERMNSMTDARPAVPSSDYAASQARSPWLGIAIIALAAFAVEMAVSARYGYVRDELYFLAAGQHSAFGYVDQPMLTPLLARLSAILTGNTLVGFRVLPALSLPALTVLTAAISRRLGAGRTGQLLAALGAATCGEYIAAAHELTTTPSDLVFWAITFLLVVHLLASQDPRWWLPVGLAIGIGADAKWNIGFLAAALAAGFLGTDARRLLRSRYLLIGLVIAAILASPDVIWQATHGWPNLDVFRALQTQAWHNRSTYWPAQVLFTGLALTPVWVAGLIWSLRSSRGRVFRPAGIGCALAILAQFVLGGKAYYPGGAYTFLLAAGCVAVERWLARRHPFVGRIRPAVMMSAAMLVSAAIMLPVGIPVLPASVLRTVPLQKINYDLAESIGWPKQVALIARAYDSLPLWQRRHTTILTGNYGEAGAVDRYGAQFGLPQVYSGANNFWLWGPPPATDSAAVVINMDPAFLRREFASVRQVSTFWNGLGVSDDEQGMPVFIVTGLKSSWAHAWPAFRNYA
jgi:hypothetical protein